MAITISTNTASINAQRHLNTSRKELDIAMERLSSGQRINSAKDDAAGLAIRDKMTAQIEGLRQAHRNNQDAISMIQTAEGAMEEITSMLQRLRTLSVQAVNDTNSGSNRQALNDETTKLKAEINRIIHTSVFNNTPLFKDDNSLTFQTGYKASDTIEVDLNAASTWLGTGEFQVNTSTSNDQINPNITGLNDGGFVVTWQSDGQDGSDNGIYGQRYDSGAAKTGAEFQINTNTSNDQTNPNITSLNDGGFVVTWQSSDQDGSGYGIYGQRYDNTGAKTGAEFQINTYTTSNQESPSITALNDGDFVVTWSSNQDDSGYGIYAQRFDSLGAAVGAEFQVNTYTYNPQQSPSITALNDGGFVVTWQSISTATNPPSYGSNGQDGSYSGIYGQRYDSTGTKTGAEFQVNTHTSYDQIYPTITALNDGGFVVSWQTYGQDSSGSGSASLSYGIYGQRYDSGGTTVGTEFQINTNTFMGAYNDQELPNITALGDGGFVVTWQSDGQVGGSDNGIYGQRYDRGGAKTGTEFQINSHTSDIQSKPNVTALNDDRFVVTWQSNNQDGSGYGIYAQRFDNSGPDTGIGNISLLTSDKAASALTTIDQAISNVSAQRSLLGASINQLSHASSNVSNMTSNTESARSVIADSDYAKESSHLAKEQIIQQAGTAMLAQANSLSQSVLSLLK